VYDRSIVLCIDCTQFVVNDSGMSLSDRFKQALAGRTKADIARDSGVAPQTLSNWLSRGSIPAKHLFRVAESLSVSPQWLSTGKGSMTQSNIAAMPSNVVSLPASNVSAQHQPMSMIPLISLVQAGGWSECIDNFSTGDAEDWLPCPSKHSNATFALRVEGDSMTNPYPGGKSFPEGTMIFVDPEREVHNGDCVVAKLTDVNEATFKMLAEDSGVKYLKPINPQYPTLAINGNCRIVGKVIGSYREE